MKIRKVNTQKYPYIIDFLDMTIEEWEQAYDWCNETFGPPFDYTDDSAVMDNRKWLKQFGGLRFSKESYAQWFILRFSGELS